MAQRLNYRPNVTARQLKSPASGTIRIAAFWPEFYFEQSLVSAMRAIKTVSHLSTEEIEVSVHFFTPGKLADVWDKMSPVGFNGVILAGASMEDLAHVAGRQRVVPVVLVNRRYESFPSVSIDHEAAGRLACELAFQRGGQSVCTVWDTVSMPTEAMDRSPRESSSAFRVRMVLKRTGSATSSHGTRLKTSYSAER